MSPISALVNFFIKAKWNGGVVGPAMQRNVEDLARAFDVDLTADADTIEMSIRSKLTEQKNCAVNTTAIDNPVDF